MKLKCTLRRWDKWSENCEIPSLKQRMFQLFDDLNIAEGDKESLYQEFLDFDFLPYVDEIHPDCYVKEQEDLFLDYQRQLEDMEKKMLISFLLNMQSQVIVSGVERKQRIKEEHPFVVMSALETTIV